MNTSITIDITTDKLHKFVKSFRQANPHIEDTEALVDAALQSRWPKATSEDIIYSAFLNQANEDFDKMVREAVRKTEEWVDTTVQGDLFSALPPVRIPKWVTDINGDRKEYWKASPEDVLAFLNARAEGLTAEIGALQETLDTKKNSLASIDVEIAKHRQIIAIARQNGIDARTVSYARQ